MTILALAEPGKETGYHAARYITAAGGFSHRGNIDFHFPETIKLYRCRLSHCHWHSRIDPLMGLLIFMVGISPFEKCRTVQSEG